MCFLLENQITYHLSEEQSLSTGGRVSEQLTHPYAPDISVLWCTVYCDTEHKDCLGITLCDNKLVRLVLTAKVHRQYPRVCICLH